MFGLRLTGRMYKFMQTFLDSRRMAVKDGDSKSKPHTLDMGVPQGSVVAPTLFSIMLHDIQRVGRPGFSISLYVDDLTIWVDCPANKNLQRHALEQFRQSIDHIQTYMKYNGFLLRTQFPWSSLGRPEGTYGSESVENGATQQTSEVSGCLHYPVPELVPHVRSLITKARRATSMIFLNSLKGKHGLHPEAWYTWLEPYFGPVSHMDMKHSSPPLTHCGWTLNELSWRLTRWSLGCLRKWNGCPYERKVASGVPTPRPVPPQCQTLSGKS